MTSPRTRRKGLERQIHRSHRGPKSWGSEWIELGAGSIDDRYDTLRQLTLGAEPRGALVGRDNHRSSGLPHHSQLNGVLMVRYFCEGKEIKIIHIISRCMLLYFRIFAA